MKRKRRMPLKDKYPPSAPCACESCRSFCRRPGWWSVGEAARAVDAGYGDRMMLELSPEFSFGVLAPAFSGCEKNFALQEFAGFGCCFLSDGNCELHGTEFMPLECRFCHHTRLDRREKCRRDIEKDWNTPAGRLLVAKWAKSAGLWKKYASELQKSGV